MSEDIAPLTRGELDGLVRQAGLRLTDKDLEGLAAVEKQLRARLARVRSGLTWANEPATVFVPPATKASTRP